MPVYVATAEDLLQAMSGASDGDEIVITADIKLESQLTIEADIVLRGEGNVSLATGGDGYGIHVTADDVTIADLTIVVDPANTFGIHSEHEGGVSFENVFVEATIPDPGAPEPGGGDDHSNAVFGSDCSDRLSGTAADDVIYAGAGEDTICGGVGNDELGGGSGKDMIAAGTGDDTIYAGSGDDVVFAAGGSDDVFGGSGDDLIFLGVSDGAHDVVHLSVGNGSDRVFGFETGTDQLDVSASGFLSFGELEEFLTSDTAGNAVIELGEGEGVILHGVAVGELDAADFIF